MRIQISACTDKVFEVGLLPLAHLTDSSASAVNDNGSRLPIKSKARLHGKRAAFPAQHAVR